MGSPPPPYQYTAPPTQKRPAPPPLPPRASVDAGSVSSPGPGPDLGPNAGPVNGWLSEDPRASSTQSLTPSVPDSTAASKRTLLIVYIHGFYGNDQSFRSFPAHVHTYLRGLLVDSHVIHSKIYPRYKTYKSIEIARDNFSAWLEPHESPSTDVILVGHSMGGLLAAEVVLMPNQNPYVQQRFKHRILGTLSLDSPFLGLHPGIIVSGIASLVQPAPKPPTQDGQELSSPSSPTDSRLSSLDLTPSIDSSVTSPSLASPLSGPPSRQNTDPYFDPPFFNDAPFREQPFLKRLVNFASKHKSEGILKALRSHLLSHLEFGGCLADYPALMNRYKKLRALEDVDEVKSVTEGHPGGSYARVRFLNYYTLSSGRPKPPKVDTPKPDSLEPDAPSQADEASAKAQAQPEMGLPGHVQSGSGVSRPSITLEEDHSDGEHRADTATAVLDSKLQDAKQDQAEEARLSVESPPDMRPLSMQELEPMPIPMDEEPHPAPEDDPLPTTEKDPSIITADQSLPDTQPEGKLDLPPIPDAPAPPDLPDLTQYTDKDARKQAEKESKRLQKAYDQAVKDRTKAIRERDKLLEKRRKKAEKEAEQTRKNAVKEKQRLDREETLDTQRIVREAEEAAEKAEAEAEAARDTVVEAKAQDAEKPEKPKKQRKFCTLPGKTNGERDSTWVDVYMEGMDEVSAHCGLFFPGPHYEPLVGDVGNRILRWVQDDLSTRAILEMDS